LFCLVSVGGLFLAHHLLDLRKELIVNFDKRLAASWVFDETIFASLNITERMGRQDVDCVKFSPSNQFLVAGSHDNFIDVFDCLSKNFPPKRRLKGHTSYITQLDFSVDGQVLQSTCGAGELLFWSMATGKLIKSREEAGKIILKTDNKSQMDLHDWKCWNKWSMGIGFCVMGIWPDFSDGTDVNGVSVSKEGNVVATADDFGGVKLFNFPCLVEDAPFVRYSGHASHVSSVLFLRRGGAGAKQMVVSAGSLDRSVIMWAYKAPPVVEVKGSSGGDHVLLFGKKEKGGRILPPSQNALRQSYDKLMFEEKKVKERQAANNDILGDFFQGQGRGQVGDIFQKNPALANELEALTEFFASMWMGGAGGEAGGGAERVEKLVRESIERHPLRQKQENGKNENGDEVGNVNVAPGGVDVAVNKRQQVGVDFAQATKLEVDLAVLKRLGLV